MIVGDINRFAFLAEKISDWSVCGFANGNMQLFVNGSGYPQQKYTATLNMELANLIGESSPLITTMCDKELFDLDTYKLFDYFCDTTFDKGDYRFQLPFEVLMDEGWFAFMVSDGCEIRIQLGRQISADKFEFADETAISRTELKSIVQQLVSFKEQL